MRPTCNLPGWKARLSMLVLVSHLWCVAGLPVLAQSPGPAATPLCCNAGTSGPQLDPQAEAERLQRYFKVIEAVGRSVPRETFDVSAVTASIGSDPAAMLAWVRERTAWVAYHGSLRGPVGVLMDRRGNSLDRASLLAELLRSTGKTVRLARAELSEAAARKLHESVSFTPRMPLPPEQRFARGDIDKLVRDYGEPYGLNSENLRRAAEALLARSEKTTQDIEQRTMSQSSTLAAMIWPPAGPSADPPAAAVQADPLQLPAVLDALRDHWWVQWTDGDQWYDLDPGLAAGADAGAPLTPLQTIDWQPRSGSWPLESKLCHEIELRVVVERWQAGRLSEQIVLRHVLRPSELIGRHIAVKHSPLDWPGDLDLSQEADPAAKIRLLASEQHEWLPVLLVGDALYYEGSFTDSGQVNPQAQISQYTRVGKAAVGKLGQVAGALDAFDAPPAAQPDAGRLTAEWLEYEIRSPGQPVRQIRRQIFDLLGPAARAAAAPIAEPAIDATARLTRGLSLLGGTEILPLVSQLSPAFVDDLMARNATGMREGLIRLQIEQDPAAIREVSEQLTKLAPLPGVLYQVALARHSVNPYKAAVYLDRPNVLSLHQSVRDDAGRGLLYSTGVDIVANEIAVRPDLGAEEAQKARLSQGVLDTNAETLLMDEGARIPTVADQLAGRPDAAQWLVLRDPVDPAWQSAGLSKDVRARIEADLAEGYAVVLPRQAVPSGGDAAIGWWRIDPGTGQALGFNGHGRGATMAESVEVGMIFYNSCILGAVAARTSGFTPPSQLGNTKAIASCAFAAIGFGSAAIAGATVTLAVAIGAAAAGYGGGLGL